MFSFAVIFYFEVSRVSDLLCFDPREKNLHEVLKMSILKIIELLAA